MRSTHRVTLIPGDGIGPEIVDATVRVLEASGAQLRFEECQAGFGGQSRFGHPVPDETVNSLHRNRIGIKGPLLVDRGGQPVVLNGGARYATANAALRGVCAAFANVRPVRSFAGIRGRYADLTIDLVIVREVSEGIYVGREIEIEPDHSAEATLVTTRAASERIARFAFELARRDSRKRVCAVHKANVLGRTDGLFLRSFYDVASEFPDIKAEDQMIDAAAALMVLNPARFDVIVAPNQYGDILSDLAAAIAGGLGVGPGGNFGNEISLFEACHGAAPDIAGRGIANPLALVLSGAMMLDKLGEEVAARRVRNGVEKFLRRGEGLTPDIGGNGTTRQAADRIVALTRDEE
ncbi:Homoisocitrate dehydrogenase [Caulifigura coniformis]|uniref:Homoisocitrate dehydrogenase n=1 Tax=Caulifigura coniformis TaxID=2527983 RepID=A0A517SIC8_9PLAN|nr:isocitrate/isopropylmalate dehydrogenase family protein [Caulifigura coniformis]QDT55883.1 Homoisocitrate dehydrogenase [Caulifigura coniformis]